MLTEHSAKRKRVDSYLGGNSTEPFYSAGDVKGGSGETRGKLRNCSSTGGDRQKATKAAPEGRSALVIYSNRYSVGSFGRAETVLVWAAVIAPEMFDGTI